MYIQAEGFDGSLVAQPPGAYDYIFLDRGHALLLDGCQIVEILTHHFGHQLYPRQLLHLEFSHQGSVSKNRNPVAHSIYLFQEMGDKDDSDSLVLKLSHQHKQLLHLTVVQGGCGFIQNQHLGRHIHRPGNGNHLLDGNGIVLHSHGHINVDIQSLQQLPGILLHGPPVNHGTFFRFSANIKVLCH